MVEATGKRGFGGDDSSLLFFFLLLVIIFSGSFGNFGGGRY